jgi:hypothetical protein
VDSSDTYFRITYKDPYCRPEYIKQPEVDNWFKQQAGYTNKALNKINGRDELMAEGIKFMPLPVIMINTISRLH